MRAKYSIFVIMCLWFLVGTATAVYPGNSTISISKSWIIANGVDQTEITVTALNLTDGHFDPIKDATVQFSVNNTKYGTLNNLTVTTNDAGLAKSTFKVNTTSGAVNVTARITSPDGYSVTRYIDVNIDHDSPYFSYFSHPLSGTVATEVPFNISITDYWGNRIDNRRGDHIISLHIHGPAPDDCNFVGGGHDISRALDPNGNFSVQVKLTTKMGPNNILMNTFGSIPDKLEWIDADNTGIPFSMYQIFSPSGSPPAIPADGESYFTIVYTLYDKYGNPTEGQWIWVNTSLSGEDKQFQSNNQGQITVQYGPRSSIGVIQIAATSVVNNTVTLSQTVEFTHTGAKIISLTANPDAMASNDVPPSTAVSNIIATVADQSGNAVPGELVNFTINSITYDGAYNVTADPVLLSPSGITNVNGRAAVQFRPGAFTTMGNPGYNVSATGHCNVIATWNGTQKIVPLSWKNYPYLSVTTSVNPLTIGINQTIDVTVEFKGDGWAMQASPIDVVLTTDRSGSMMYDNPDRMVNIMGAAATFVDQMGVNDQIGLVSFGQKGTAEAISYNDLGPGKDSDTKDDKQYVKDHYLDSPKNYADYATVDLLLSFDQEQVKTAIKSMVPYSGTPMRSALYKSIQEINSPRGRSGTVKAIILLSDGDYNWYGDPLARGTGYADSSNHRADDYSDLTNNYMTFSGLTGTGQFSEQNMSVYAKNSGIKIYSIAFGNDISSKGRTTLRILAEGTVLADGTNGTYYEAQSTNIEEVYKAIATDLKDTAGVNTTMVVNFENINVTGVTVPGNQVYDYVYHPTYSTKINWQNGTTTVPAIDQSADWAADNKLDFTIGTIKVGQKWNATFRLKVKQGGLIDVFGNHSTVSFNGGTEIMNLPQTFITVIPHLNVTEITAKTIALDSLIITNPGEITTFLPVMWNTTYTGNKTITEQIYYSIDNGPWVQFKILAHNYPHAPDVISATEYVDYADLDVTKLPPGGYKIKVVATSSDAPDAMAETDYKTVGGRGKVFIKLEAPPFDGQIFDQNWQNPWGILRYLPG